LLSNCCSCHGGVAADAALGNRAAFLGLVQRPRLWLRQRLLLLPLLLHCHS